MSIVATTYERSTFQVEAVRVTSENMEEIAEWCGGRVVSIYSHGIGRNHIQVPVGQIDKVAHAYIGNWVTCLVKTKSFRVYKEKAFLTAFREIQSESDKYAKVHELLMEISRAQDAATYHGDSSGDVVLLVEKNAREICKMI